jgi:pSer/pThr/pTyr-binding forkhead associated (FHA) protein
MAEFEIIKDGHSEKRIPWNDEILLVGRDAMASLCIPDEHISRRHARILVEKGLLTVQDLDTRNGTFVNGRREYKRPLKDGDRIEFGSYVILVHIGPKDRFADTPILEGEMEDSADLFDGGFVSSEGSGATAVVGPGLLARMRQEHEIKISPHLVLTIGKKTAFFPLKFQTTIIGSSDACQVRVNAMRSSRAVMITRLDPTSYQVKKLGLCVKLKVAGRTQRVTTVGNNGTFEVDGYTFILKVGRIRPTSNPGSPPAEAASGE